jgi:hypothetical protein
MVSSISFSHKRIYDVEPFYLSPVPKIFGQKNPAAGLLGGSDNEGIPKGKAMQAMQIDGGEDIGKFGSGYIKLCQQLDFSTSNGRIQLQLPRHSNEVFL